ncbi:ATP-binding protein [Streptomyces sp. NRRL S-87]|uniref:ATP-binding protein n=1 Tax=Streptomyces sp. NRRL S-87 TaxID=1463920 RepID=UPI0004C0A748|nr:ATP-binding protein [Streptomyces sp. NRRL S-87]
MDRYLLGRLAIVEARVRRAVAARRAGDPEADDPFRGLYLSDETVRRILDDPGTPMGPDEVDARALAALPAPGDSRLGLLVRNFGLGAGGPAGAGGSAHAGGSGGEGGPGGGGDVLGGAPGGLDAELLLIALAPDLDRRFEQLYGYLNDDVTRRRPSVGLALALCGVPAASAAARARLSTAGPLAARGLLLVEEPERPLLSRSLRVPDRVSAYLLGDDSPDPALADLLAPGRPGLLPVDALGDLPDRLAAALHAPGLVYLREPAGGVARALAVDALARAGHRALVLDPARLTRQAGADVLVAAAGREAALTGAGLVAGPVEALAEKPELLRALAGLCGADGAPSGTPYGAAGEDPARAATGYGVPVLLTGQAGWDPAWSDRVPLLVEVARLGAAARASLWEAVLGAPAGPAVSAFVLTPEQMERAARTARQQADLARGDGPGAELAPAPDAYLLQGARAQNTSGLERLARRIGPGVGWDDLVLPPVVLGQLRELAARARHRDRVLGDWAMRPGGGRGRGVMALFAGDSGTGKTMSAEVIAGALGLDLYTVDLATVVDKYVGETEKNLERIFTEAAGVNGVLLFDEADAVFGKRSEVKDAHDRYANVESAYLLQRMETFDGLAVLATNLRANLDEAFTRRLDLVVDFPLPDAAQRTALWDRCLGSALPRGDDLDLVFCGQAFELAGGDIRSAAVTAAYLAADAGRPVGMADLVAAVAREYRKLGRLCLASEFGPYLHLAR